MIWFKVESLHIPFIRQPTFNQLRIQWKYIEDNITKLICYKDNESDINGIINRNICHSFEHIIKCRKNTRFYIHDLRKIFHDNDNVKDCTGKIEQLPGIAAYFQIWMS